MSEFVAGQSRRSFLKGLALAGGSAVVATGSGSAFAQMMQQNSAPIVSTSPWARQIGLELFTVRDMLGTPKSYEATLEKIAAIGYKEIEPATGYAGMSPKDFRAMLDRLGLSMPSTHSAATEGADLEAQLDGFAVMGLKYVEISAPRPPRAPGAPGGPGGPGGQQAPQTSDAVKRTADQLNEHGKIAKKHGMKILVHNHTMEFAPLADNAGMKPYDILLANTDPSLVAMQIDIGWAYQAGQDPIAMFHKNPGRYELWHVKDMNDIKLMPPSTDEATRMRMGMRAIVPVSLGDIDYKPVFAQAELAGMKHFCVEQDSAAAWGDSIASAGVCYTNLLRVLG